MYALFILQSIGFSGKFCNFIAPSTAVLYLRNWCTKIRLRMFMQIQFFMKPVETVRQRFVSPIKRYDAYYIGYFTYFYTLICISAHFNFLRIQVQLSCFTFVRHRNFVTCKWNNLDQTLLTSSFAFELWTFPS